MTNFYNREQELSILTEDWETDGAKLMLLYGRRRVGKTYLLQHFFSAGHPHCYFLASTVANQENIAQLAETLLQAIPDASGLSSSDFPTFRSVLQFYGEHSRETRFALVLDEFQYLVQRDPSIPSQLQAWWDTTGLQSQAFVVLCGSHIGIMEELAGASQPLFGRFTSRRRLTPMTCSYTAKFYEMANWSIRDKMIAYGILGGTPRYHALFEIGRDVGWNVCKNVLSSDGLLRNEPEVLISSSTIRDPVNYNSVLRAIALGDTRMTAIANRTGLTQSQLGFYLNNLIELEWIAREMPFGEHSTKSSIYRITDHFVHFWYRFVSRFESALEFQETSSVYHAHIEPFLNDYMGRYVFEDICLQYLRREVLRKHGLHIKEAGRYWNRDNSVEIDIVAELDDGGMLVCEAKWSSTPLDIETYYSLMRKVAYLPTKGRNTITYMLFSLAGFNRDMKSRADKDGVILVSGEELLKTSE